METVETTVEVEHLEERQPNLIFDAAHKTFQAGLGAVALTQSELESFFGKLVERGEVAEKDGRKMIEEFMEKRRTRSEEAQDELETNVERVLHTMNVPTKSDIDKLNVKIAELTEKIDALLKE